MTERGAQAKLDRPYLMSLNAFNDSYAAIENGRWKWILYRRERYLQLFDLHNDPQELNNLSDLEIHQDRIDQFKDLMRSFLHQGRETYNAPFHYKPYDANQFEY
jgi:arylsulfatase A-like enzyme